MILKLLSALSDRDRRFEAGKELAAYFNCQYLIIFITDPEIGILLPALGFPATLPKGNLWSEFTRQCRLKSYHSGNLPFPTADNCLPSVGILGPDNSVAILLGGSPSAKEVKPLCDIMPLITSLLNSEQANATAEIRVKLADKSALKAEKLANTIDLMRLHLKEALIRQEKDKKDIEDLMKKKDEFMNVASHELKTPITSMKAYMQILERQIPQGQRDFERNFIQKANKQVDRLNALVSDLLDVSKIQAGQMIYQFSTINMAGVIKDVVEQIQMVVPTHRLLLKNNIPVLVNGERQRLEQVISNFLSNAIKYSPKADEVIINSEIIEDHLKVSIRDFGIGIPPDKRAYVFDRFFRVQESSQHFPGLGLGLYISSVIVERHGGRIGMENPEIGSEFYFTLPILKEDSQSLQTVV